MGEERSSCGWIEAVRGKVCVMEIGGDIGVWMNREWEKGPYGWIERVKWHVEG